MITAKPTASITVRPTTWFKKPVGTATCCGSTTIPVKGTLDGFNPAAAGKLAPSGCSIVGEYCTYEDQSTASGKRTTKSKDTFISDNFSSPDIEEITADAKGKLGYSGTPSGAF